MSGKATEGATAMPVLHGAEPFSYDGQSGTGVLLCHGFTSSPASMRDWGLHLAREGLRVRCPRLPGHGTSWQEMNKTRADDWYDHVRAELRELLAECDTVFVCGLSLGGTLALRLAEDFGTDIAGLCLVNPSVCTTRRDFVFVGALSRLVASVAGLGGDIAKPHAAEQSYSRVPLRAAASLPALWNLVRTRLHLVTQPLLLMHSLVDHVVEPVNAEIVATNVSSTQIVDVTLPNSFHVATLDYDAELIFRRSTEFINTIHTREAGQRWVG